MTGRRCRRCSTATIRGATARGEGAAFGHALALQALMHNGYGQYDKALAAAQQGCEHEEVMAYNGSLVELVEAGVAQWPAGRRRRLPSTV